MGTPVIAENINVDTLLVSGTPRTQFLFPPDPSVLSPEAGCDVVTRPGPIGMRSQQNICSGDLLDWLALTGDP